MYLSNPAVVRLPSVVRASLSTEPKVLFVYLLLLVVPWVLWQGHRTGGEGPDQDVPTARESDEGAAGRAARPSDRGEAGKKRRPGQIDWIQ